jgi:hypothetical protein
LLLPSPIELHLVLLSKNLFQLTHNYKLEKKKNPSTNPEIKHEKASFNKSIDRFFIGGIVVEV